MHFYAFITRFFCSDNDRIEIFLAFQTMEKKIYQEIFVNLKIVNDPNRNRYE